MNTVVLRQHVFQRQHDTGQLAAGGHLLNGLQILAQVGRHQKLHLIHTRLVHAPLPRFWEKFRLKPDLGHVQLPQLLPDALLKAFCRLFPGLGEGFAVFLGGFPCLFQFLFQPDNRIICVLNLIQLLAAFL